MSEDNINLVNINDWQVLQLVIREGFGFAQACDMTRNDHAVVTAQLKKNTSAMAALHNAGRGYVVELVKASNEAGTKGDNKTASEIREKLGKWPGLNLWANVCTKKTAKPELVAKTFARLKRADEVAISCGMNYEEYATYVVENGELIRNMLAEVGIRNPQLI